MIYTNLTMGEKIDQASKLGCIKADYYIDVYNINSNGVKHLKKAADLGDPDAQKHSFHIHK